MQKELNKYLIPDLTNIVLDYSRDDTYFKQCMQKITWYNTRSIPWTMMWIKNSEWTPAQRAQLNRYSMKAHWSERSNRFCRCRF